MWCSHCSKDCETVKEPDQNFVCCHYCGKVLENPIYKRRSIKTRKKKGLDRRAGNLERLFDIDDFEVARYLHSEEEIRLRKIIWEEMNKEYLEAQAIKKAMAAAAAREACEAKSGNGFEELSSAQEIAAVTALDLAKFRNVEKKHKHAISNRNSSAAKYNGKSCRELKRKSFSSKINYEVLESLYKDDAKKQRIASETGEDGIDELKPIDEETHKEDEEAADNNYSGHINDDDDHHMDGNGNGYDDHYCNDENDGDYYGNGGEDDYYGGVDDEHGFYDEWDA